MKGWTGKLLRVDLKNSKCRVEELNEDIAKKYIGGRGIGSKMLLDEIDPKVDPFSPENKMFILTGPLTGTGAPCGARLQNPLRQVRSPVLIQAATGDLNLRLPAMTVSFLKAERKNRLISGLIMTRLN